jgi:hypothetical protein
MSKVFVSIGLVLDGYMAPEGMTVENWDKPDYMDWGAKWGALMGWIVDQQYFRENLKLGPGGETGPVNEMLRNTTERIGANIMGNRMFDGGEGGWPEDAPFHTPGNGGSRCGFRFSRTGPVLEGWPPDDLPEFRP